MDVNGWMHGESTHPILLALPDECAGPCGDPPTEERSQSTEGSDCTSISDKAIRQGETPLSCYQEQLPACSNELTPEDIAAVGLIVAMSQASRPAVGQKTWQDCFAQGMLPAPERLPGMPHAYATGIERPPPKPMSAVAFSRRNAPYICQVVECQRNLMREKEYYRRYRVCKVHATIPLVRTCGEDRRYCQQCSVFHALHEFDGAKRSCRARLNWHNNKRRKRGVHNGDGVDSDTTTADAAAAVQACPVGRRQASQRRVRPPLSWHVDLLLPSRLLRAEGLASTADPQPKKGLRGPSLQSPTSRSSFTGKEGTPLQGTAAVAAPSDLSAAPRTRPRIIHPVSNPRFSFLGAPLQRGSLVTMPPLFLGSTDRASHQPASGQRSDLLSRVEQNLAAGSPALVTHWEEKFTRHQWLEPASATESQARDIGDPAYLLSAAGSGPGRAALSAPRAYCVDSQATVHHLQPMEQGLDWAALQALPQAVAPAAAQPGGCKAGLRAALLVPPQAPAVKLKTAGKAVPGARRLAYATQVAPTMPLAAHWPGAHAAVASISASVSRAQPSPRANSSSDLQQVARSQHLAKLQEQADAAARSELPDPRKTLSLVNVVRAALAAQAESSMQTRAPYGSLGRNSAFRPCSRLSSEAHHASAPSLGASSGATLPYLTDSHGAGGGRSTSFPLDTPVTLKDQLLRRWAGDVATNEAVTRKET